MTEDTSNDRRLATEKEARQVAEGAREEEWEKLSFARRLFDGRFEPELLRGLPRPSGSESERADAWLADLERFALESIDGDAFDLFKGL